jgi:selenoprotein W-related protein
VSAEIEQHYQVAPRLTAGGGGVFDVVVDDCLLFSKHDSGRFPDVGEIASLIQQHNNQ